MQTKRQIEDAPNAQAVVMRIYAMDGECLGCEGCRGMCKHLFDLMTLPDAILKKERRA